ncbi:MAG TPA: tRNA pseudouridine(38-40) synthase TruA [Acidobacteriota bacterium]|nr:tRNA pseudouridine(38-40) synthase TruA [Acidobacteriota bacterium]
MQRRKPGYQTRKPAVTGRNIRLTLAYDGTEYHGWQVQKGAPTIQGILRSSIQKITGEPVSIVGSGRTDAGTHVRRTVANFVTNSRIPPGQLVRALNSNLPRDIRVLSARLVPAGFHARYSAHSKIYRYQIYRGAVLLPHLAREHFHYPYPLDLARMREAARYFVGEHDFASFAAGTPMKNTVRRVFRCELKIRGRRLTLTVEGNGFLHHMVRNMTGTLLEVGRGRLSLTEFQELFEKRDRSLAGFTAPAHGLILLNVRY